MRSRRAVKVLSLLLVALHFGGTSSEGFRSCPHHGDEGEQHESRLYGHAAADGPTRDPGPCDHNPLACENVATDPATPATLVRPVADDNLVVGFSLSFLTRLGTSEASFLLPYSTGPPPA